MRWVVLRKIPGSSEVWGVRESVLVEEKCFV